MKYLPTDVSTFSTMIMNNYIYVDKTEYIYNLFSGGTRYYFLSRPRRFGKSLLISTLKELFTNNRTLFKNLWINTSDYHWQEYPVIHLDFSAIAHETTEKLETNLSWRLQEIGKQYNLDISAAPTPHAKFTYLIEQLSKRNKVVILIDEYDKPILDHLADPKKASQMKASLTSIYDILKGMDAHLRAIFITGVTKFAKTSIFSGINNLNDITMAEKGSVLLGYTKEEVTFYFHSYIKDFAHSKNITVDALSATIKQYYNGYRFSEKESYVYNPFSVLYCLDRKKFANYWFESGTPSFLIELLKTQGSKIKNIETIEISSSSLGTFDINAIHIFPILFQTGYLTIRDYHETEDRYILGYPNSEVKDSFIKYVIATFADSSTQDVEQALTQFKQALYDNDIELFCTTLTSLLANIPYQLHIGNEAYYHSLLQFLITLLGLEGHSEISSSKGRIDMVLETKTNITIFEFKFASSGQKALAQIMEKKYYEKYLHLKKPITLVGLSFNIHNKELNLDWVKKVLQIITSD